MCYELQHDTICDVSHVAIILVLCTVYNVAIIIRVFDHVSLCTEVCDCYIRILDHVLTYNGKFSKGFNFKNFANVVKRF